MPNGTAGLPVWVTLIDAESRVADLPRRTEGVWVYALVDPREPERVRYVGRTQKPLVRFMEHVEDTKTHGEAKRLWHQEMTTLGCVPRMIGLEYVAYVPDSVERERHWQDYYAARGGADLNKPLSKGRRARLAVLFSTGDETCRV